MQPPAAAAHRVLCGELRGWRAGGRQRPPTARWQLLPRYAPRTEDGRVMMHAGDSAPPRAARRRPSLSSLGVRTSRPAAARFGAVGPLQCRRLTSERLPGFWQVIFRAPELPGPELVQVQSRQGAPPRPLLSAPRRSSSASVSLTRRPDRKTRLSSALAAPPPSGTPGTPGLLLRDGSADTARAAKAWT